MKSERFERSLPPVEQQDGGALALAQFASFARLVPMMYITLLANTWVMTASFIGHAAWWMTWLPASSLTLVAHAACFSGGGAPRRSCLLTSPFGSFDGLVYLPASFLA
jgi:hypothetical protein